MQTQLKLALKPVARSFYLSLAILPPPLRDGMGLGYLFCRAADSLADTDLLPPQDRKPALSEFHRLFDHYPLDGGAVKAFVSNWESRFRPATAEFKLVKSLPLLLHVYDCLHSTERALIQDVVVGVIKGMEADLTSFGAASDSLRALPTKADLEAYLGWIGGEPGRFWTRLTLHHFPELVKDDKSRWTEDGIQFGKGLQMVNILRDLPADLKNGRCYIPDAVLKKSDLSAADLLTNDNPSRFIPLFHTLIDEAVHRLQSGLTYVSRLPRSAVRLRSAVWWPLSIGLQTLEKLRLHKNPLEPGGPVKITRKEIYWTMGSSAFFLPFNRLLKWDFEDLAGRASSSLDGKTVDQPNLY